MKYIIIYNNKASYTAWFDVENNWDNGMVVIDLYKDKYYAGNGWIEMEYDCL